MTTLQIWLLAIVACLCVSVLASEGNDNGNEDDNDDSGPRWMNRLSEKAKERLMKARKTMKEFRNGVRDLVKNCRDEILGNADSNSTDCNISSIAPGASLKVAAMRMRLAELRGREIRAGRGLLKIPTGFKLRRADGSGEYSIEDLEVEVMEIPAHLLIKEEQGRTALAGISVVIKDAAAGENAPALQIGDLRPDERAELEIDLAGVPEIERRNWQNIRCKFFNEATEEFEETGVETIRDKARKVLKCKTNHFTDFVGEDSGFKAIKAQFVYIWICLMLSGSLMVFAF